MAVADGQLAGRGVELDRLTAALLGVSEGSCEAIVLTGEPGIGKSRLIAETLASANARRHLVFSARAEEFERDLPFGMFLDALDPYLGSLDSRRLRSLTGEDLVELAAVFPALRSSSSPDAAGHGGRFASYRAVGALLELLARERPVVLALDDLHWADQASIGLIGHLLRRPPRAAILVLLAARSAQAPRRLAAELLSARDRGACEVIELDPLTREEAEALLGTLDDADLKDALYAETGGNPFYLQQLVRSPEHLGREPFQTERLADVPAAVRRAIETELDRVSSRCRKVLDAASIAGDPCFAELVAAVAESDRRDTFSAIDEAIAAGLLRGTDVPGYFTFRHPIVRRSVYELTPLAWRIGCHARAAAALAASGASPLACASHVERSAAPGDEAAIALLSQAGQASSAQAPASAARWFAAALRLLPESAPPDRRLAQLFPLATMLIADGQVEQASAKLAETLSLIPRQQPVLRARVVTARAVMERLLGRTDRVRAALEAALDELPASASAERAALTVELAADGYFHGDWEGMGEPARRAFALARRTGDASLKAAAAAVLALAEINAGLSSAAIRHSEQASALLDAIADDELAVHLGAAHWVGWSRHHVERYGDVVRHYERALAIARSRDQSHLLVPTLMGLAISYTWLGDVVRAVEQATAAAENAELIGAEQMIALTWGLRAWVAVRAGRLHEAIELAQEPVGRMHPADDGVRAALPHLWLGEARIEAGAPATGRDEMLLAAGGDELPWVEPSHRSYYFGVLSRAELLLDDVVMASGWAERAQAAADRLELAGPRVWALRSRADVALAGSEHGQAIALARGAATIAGGTHPLERERCLLVLGRALAASGSYEEAIDTLEAVREAFVRYGAGRLAETAARELRRLGRHVPRSGIRGRGSDGLDSLSGRELEVALLVTDRLTNREIAQRLVLSEKTVERHLAHIFEKLDVNSRVAVARTVERAGPH
jgi:DNA-binding CsgD family transcriptional regulator